MPVDPRLESLKPHLESFETFGRGFAALLIPGSQPWRRASVFFVPCPGLQVCPWDKCTVRTANPKLGFGAATVVLRTGGMSDSAREMGACGRRPYPASSPGVCPMAAPGAKSAPAGRNPERAGCPENERRGRRRRLRQRLSCLPLREIRERVTRESVITRCLYHPDQGPDRHP